MKLEPIAHRGWWDEVGDQNSELAFRRALDAGFGIETDLRDRDGEIVISHDMASADAMPCSRLFDLVKASGSDRMLALNIKSDGLSRRLEEMLRSYGISHYFVFDMSVPELLRYRVAGLTYFTRKSEYEPEPACYGEADGVWMDQFEGNWIGEADIVANLKEGKKVCLVSPELHRREYRLAWQVYRAALANPAASANAALFLCTDYPQQAREFFGP